MRILMLNWKDSKHSLAGGAEIVTHEYAKQLVRFGHHVTLITSHESNLSKSEKVDGVHIVRKGSIVTVRLWAAWLYVTKFKAKTDVIIDQVHGLPFFTPLYASRPIVAFIHEVAGPIWFLEFPFLLALIGYVWEKSYFWLYKNVIFLTDTPSTKKELVKLGLKPSRVTIIPLTISPLTKRILAKSKTPLLVYVGRLSRVKRIERLIESTAQLVHTIPNLKVIISGTGKSAYVKQLKQYIVSLHLRHHVLLTGYLPESKKISLLRRAWIHVQPSLKEGFGLTCLEAATQSTPTVCFDVPGLKDVVSPQTGVVIQSDTLVALTQTLAMLLTNHKLRKQLGYHAYLITKRLPAWETQAKQLEVLLMKTIN